jgi:catechol 2,3-dioxygenase-like lactoylglutathione lyase family enzyme
MQQKSGIFHVHLIVRDIARSIRFYREVFGMTVLDFRDAELPELVFLSTPGRTDLLTLNPDPNMQELAGKNGGVEHFGIKLADTDLNGAIAKVIDPGGKLLRRTDQPVGLDRVYMEDPDGYVIEIQPQYERMF